MKVVAQSCRLKSEPGEDGSVVVNASFTMRPDPNMDTIIGQTAHNLDEVSRHKPRPYPHASIGGVLKTCRWVSELRRDKDSSKPGSCLCIYVGAAWSLSSLLELHLRQLLVLLRLLLQLLLRLLMLVFWLRQQLLLGCVPRTTEALC